MISNNDKETFSHTLRRAYLDKASSPPGENGNHYSKLDR